MNTTEFKLTNVSTESTSIKITDNLSISSSNEANISFGSVPKVSLYQMSSIQDEFGLHRFMDSLCNSNVIISCSISDNDMEENPFGIDDCSFLAISLAIMYKSYFIAGIEKFTNSKGGTSWGPWTTCFDGLRNENSIHIHTTDEDQIREIYTFVFDSFTNNTHSSKLLNLFCKCCCLSSNNNFHVLKIGLPNFGNDYATRIVNSALLFEMISGEYRARNIRTSINTLNSILSTSISIDDVIRIMNYRHLLVHDDASIAKTEIDNWLIQTGKTEEEGYEWAYKESILVAKEFLKAIILNYPTYLNYKQIT
jgi:hypothetical protein